MCFFGLRAGMTKHSVLFAQHVSSEDETAKFGTTYDESCIARWLCALLVPQVEAVPAVL